MTNDLTIPHAHTVTRIEDPPCVTLHVETALLADPTIPGFNAAAKTEMLRAIAELVNREGFAGYRIVWSVPLPAALTPAVPVVPGALDGKTASAA
jgi:hypothetical protein